MVLDSINAKEGPSRGKWDERVHIELVVIIANTQTQQARQHEVDKGGVVVVLASLFAAFFFRPAGLTKNRPGNPVARVGM